MKSIAAALGGLILVIIAIVVFFGIGFWGTYNGLTSADNEVDRAWGQVQAAYQRRADLVPQLVATVKGASENEKSIKIEVAKARASVGQIKIDPTNAPDAATLKQFQEAQGQLGAAISRLLMVTESDPNVRSTDNFTILQTQLEGGENRINTERKRYNDAVLAVNNKVRGFPGNMLAGFAGVSRREPFAADQGAQAAPTVSFK